MIHRIYTSDSVNALDLAQDSQVFKSSDAAEGMTIDIDYGCSTPTIKKTVGLRLQSPSFFQW